MNAISQVVIAVSLMVLIGGGIKIIIQEIKQLFSKK